MGKLLTVISKKSICSLQHSRFWNFCQCKHFPIKRAFGSALYSNFDVTCSCFWEDSTLIMQQTTSWRRMEMHIFRSQLFIFERQIFILKLWIWLVGNQVNFTNKVFKRWKFWVYIKILFKWWVEGYWRLSNQIFGSYK